MRAAQTPLFVLALLLSASAVHAQDTPALAEVRARSLAANCMGCHGTNGRSAGGMPSLAGLDKNYIVRQMNDFKSGARPATVMQQIAKAYSDQQIAQLAEYFGKQKN
jgi:cytochrome subunit of sulfide dehydrogenase